VYEFVKIHPGCSKNLVVKHFSDENVSKTTIYDILQRMEKNIGPDRKQRVTPPHCKMTQTKIKRLQKVVDHHHGISQNALAQQFEVSQSTISQTIKNKTSIRYYKKRKAPKRTPLQQILARPKCFQLCQLFRKKQIIIDDESYFGLRNFELSGNTGFYSSDINATLIDVKVKRKAKFEQKLLVWVALSPKGLSRHYIVPSGQAINEEIYINKCLRTRLVSFIETYHKNDEIIFWPDLASSHYSNKVQEFLRSKNIDFVPKSRNIANVPELRPIEDFWSLLKREVYEKCWKAENLGQLKSRIEYCIKKLDLEQVHRLGNASFTRVDAARRHGIKNL